MKALLWQAKKEKHLLKILPGRIAKSGKCGYNGIGKALWRAVP